MFHCATSSMRWTYQQGVVIIRFQKGSQQSQGKNNRQIAACLSPTLDYSPSTAPILCGVRRDLALESAFHHDDATDNFTYIHIIVEMYVISCTSIQ